MTETKHHPDHLVHLFLRDAPRFFVSVVNRLEELFPAAKEELDAIKQRAIHQLKSIYTQEQIDLWRKEGLKPNQAFAQWSSPEESQRQEQTIKLLKENLYDALVVAETEIALEHDLTYDSPDDINEAVYQLYRSILDHLMTKRLEELRHSGRLDIKSHSIVSIEGKTDRPLDVKLHLTQWGDRYVSDYSDPSIDLPINALIDEIVVTPPGGESLSWKKMRGAAFDLYRVRQPHHLNRMTDPELAPERHRLNNLSQEKLKAHVHGLLIQRDPLALQTFVDALNWNPVKLGQPSPYLEKYIKKEAKYKRELEELLNEFDIIEASKVSITHFLTNAQSANLGFSIPTAVLEAFQKHDVLRNPSWAFINLLQPHNIYSPVDLNKFIWRKLEKKGFPPLTFSQFMDFTLKNPNPLDSIYREMIAFKEIESHGTRLFFSFPISLKKELSSIFFKDLKINYLPGPHMLYTEHDLSRYKTVNEETNKSLNTVLQLGREAIQLLEAHSAQNPAKKPILSRHKMAIESLLQYPFEPSDESLARLNLLLEMLNIRVHVHDRDGVRELANWSARCNQLLACCAASSDGRLPAYPIPESHWSFEVYLRTFPLQLELHKALKKSSGGKRFLAPIKNIVLARALTRGAYDLIERFDVNSLNEARLRLQQEEQDEQKPEES